jgi:hypothetical protein
MKRRVLVIALAMLGAVAIALLSNRITMMTLEIIGTTDGNVQIRSGLSIDGYTYTAR